MLTTLAAPAFAEIWHIENGDITISAGESGNNVTQNNNTTYGDTNTIITNQNKDTASSHTVTIETNDKNDKVEVTLKDVNIDTSSRNKAAVSVTGEGDTNIKLDGDNALKSDIYRSGIYGSGSGSLTISGGENDSLTAQGGSGANGISSSGSLTISGGTVTANGGSGSYRGGSGISSSDIELSGSLELTAKAGSPNGKALSQNGSELDPNTFKEKLDPGANIITKDADGKVIDQVSSPRPVEPEGPVIPEESSSSSDSGSATPSADGGSSTPSAPASPLPGLTVTDKSGQHISYTSIRDNNVLSLRVGRFTASFRISPATLRQLRAEGIDTITFRTVLCSTTLSVDELLAMGGEDAEVVLTHHIRSSTLTVGGKAV